MDMIGGAYLGCTLLVKGGVIFVVKFECDEGWRFWGCTCQCPSIPSEKLSTYQGNFLLMAAYALPNYFIFSQSSFLVCHSGPPICGEPRPPRRLIPQSRFFILSIAALRFCTLSMSLLFQPLVVIVTFGVFSIFRTGEPKPTVLGEVGDWIVEVRRTEVDVGLVNEVGSWPAMTPRALLFGVMFTSLMMGFSIKIVRWLSSILL